jgi:hypothetical protein
VNGRLVHDVVSGIHPAGTVFVVTILANRGRLPAAGSATFTRSASALGLQLFGWGPGSPPVVNPLTDDWSRRPRMVLRRSFTSWAPNGQWASQTFEFVTGVEVHYLSLAISAKNHVSASYVAFDLQASP